MIGVSSGTHNGVLDDCEVSVSYTLWRNPEDRSDPVNLAELDEQQLAALAAEPPWPRPPWLVDQVQLMRYPVLWECVRTAWSARPDPVGVQLAAHVNHILLNQFRHTRVLRDTPPFQVAGPVDERSVETGIPVLVDGVASDGVRIDTDPDIYGVGVELGGNVVLTAAIPRHALPYLDISFTVRTD